MISFFKWLIVTAVYGTTIFVSEWKYSFFSNLAADDTSYICYIIWFLFLVGTVLAAIQSLASVQCFKRLNYLAELCPQLGLLGSVWGILITFGGIDLTSVDAGDPTAIIAMMDGIVSGLATALTTTCTGIIASVMLSVYPFILKGKKDA